MLLKSIARICVKYAGNAAGFGVAGDAILDIWDAWNKDSPDQQQKLAEVQQLAEQSAGETRQLAQALAQEVAADQPETVRHAVASYLTQVPAMVRRSLKRPADPTGRTLPPGLLFGKPEDLLELLPAKPARFKPGDCPLPGVDWELDELLGVGGFGEVWRAHNPMFDGVAPVALKFCTDADAAKSLRHEAAVLNQVMRQGKHPGIVQLQHTYLRAEPPCLEYEYVADGDLTGLIHDRHQAPGGCSLLAMTKLIGQLAEIVGFAHRLSPPIVHRDLKTANILVSQLVDGTLQLKVADFGIGGIGASQILKDAQPRPTSYVTAMAKGTCTPLYASPQQQRGEPADPRDDVYSIGVIWYQALTGNLSAGRPGGAAWRRRLVDQGLPASVVDLLESCFEDDPDSRPRDAAELAERMKALLPTAAAGGEKVHPLDPPATIQPRPPTLPTVAVAKAGVTAPMSGPAHDDEAGVFTNSIDMKFVLIPAGTFRMGSPDGENDRQSDEGPVHEVQITRPFYLGVTPVTQEQHELVMRTNPSWFSAKGRGKDKVRGMDTRAFPCGERVVGRGDGVLQAAVGVDGGSDEWPLVPSADGGGMGVFLSGRGCFLPGLPFR